MSRERFLRRRKTTLRRLVGTAQRGSKVPKVVISGYYGFGNCGDEAMLFAIVTQLRRRIPAVELVVLSQQPAATARDFGVRAIDRRDFALIWRELRDADLLLSGGGSLFQDVTSPRSVFYYAAIILMAWLRGKKICLYGQGVGPLNRWVSRLLVKKVVELADLVTVRDPGSLQELRSLGVRRPVHVTADPVLGLTIPAGAATRGEELLGAAGIGMAPLVGISLRRWPQVERVLPAVARAVARLIAEGWRAVLLPLQPDDYGVLTALQKELGGVPRLLKIEGFHDLMAVAGRLNLGIGMRLHFLIFAALAGVPAVGLSYDPKVARFMAAVGLPTVGIDEVTPEKLVQAVQDLRVRDMAVGLSAKVSELKVLAEENADLVAALISR
ncbi:polysaccharide pyruvyl transferase CsaB [Thermodesulfitimonas sp.]